VTRTRVKSWLAYAVTGLLATTLIALLVRMIAPASAARAIWLAAAIAYAVQLAAFGALLAVRGQGQLFMVAWLGGMVVRFGVLGLGAFLLSSTDALPRGAALISYVGFVFLLLLLEPLFLRWDLRGS
jgi:hypothetical protein